jgi:hypothetical protein
MIDDELVHLTCGHCGNISSLSYRTLPDSGGPPCPYCGHTLPVDAQKAHNQALREATELDAGPDALGSQE